MARRRDLRRDDDYADSEDEDDVDTDEYDRSDSGEDYAVPLASGGAAGGLFSFAPPPTPVFFGTFPHAASGAASSASVAGALLAMQWKEVEAGTLAAMPCPAGGGLPHGVAELVVRHFGSAPADKLSLRIHQLVANMFFSPLVGAGTVTILSLPAALVPPAAPPAPAPSTAPHLLYAPTVTPTFTTVDLTGASDTKDPDTSRLTSVRVTADAFGLVQVVEIIVPVETRELGELLQLLGRLMYESCILTHRTTLVHMVIALQVLGLMTPLSVRTQVMHALETNFSNVEVDSSVLVDWLMAPTCKLKLSPSIAMALEEQQAFHSLCSATCVRCVPCKLWTSATAEHCRFCGTGLTAPVVGGLHRMPTDLDPAFFSAPAEELAELNKLTTMQRKAVDFVVDSAQSQSNHARGALLARLQRMGHGEKVLRQILRYVRDHAPIIIHVNLQRIAQFLQSDTHYRNQFETKTSGGHLSASARIQWEDRLFSKAYHHSSAFDRVKYGVLNIVCDPFGVRSCYSYGSSYLVLKRVRLRTTFADMDSSSPTTSLAMCEYHYHVLNNYTDPELAAVIDVATGKAPWRPSTCISNYKEVQVHGEIRFDTHVAALVVAPEHHGDTRLAAAVQEASALHGFPVIWLPESLQQKQMRKAREEAAERARAAHAERGKWACAVCSAKQDAEARTCTACSAVKPMPPRHTRDPWVCEGCAASNPRRVLTCVRCSKVPPTWTCASCNAINPNCNTACTLCKTGRPVPGKEWFCASCTSKNASSLKVCAVCSTSRTELAVPTATWQCGQCTVENAAGTAMCSVCGTAYVPGLVVRPAAATWHCSTCTASNAAGTSVCSVCSTPGTWTCTECAVAWPLDVASCGCSVEPATPSRTRGSKRRR